MRRFLISICKGGVGLSIFMMISAVMNETLFWLDRYVVPGNEKVVIIGDSHPMYGLRPDVIESSVNIAQFAEPYTFTFYKLRSVLETNRDVETVLLGFGAHNIGGKNDGRFADGGFAALMFGRYKPIMSWHEWSEFPLSTNSWGRVLVSKYLVPSRHYLVNRLPGVLTNGFRTYPYVGGFIRRSDSHLQSKVLDKIIGKYYSGPTADQASAISLEYLERMVELTTQAGVRLVLVSMPVHPDYRGRIPASIMRVFAEVSARYASDPRVDVFDLSQFPLPDEHYLDFDHVTGAGAHVVSEVVNDALQQGRGELMTSGPAGTR